MSGTIRVLHVDGEPDSVERAAEYLEREYEKFDIVVETSAAGGLDRLESEPVHCVVSSNRLPDTDGLTFLRRIREESPALPFILFTDANADGLAGEAFDRGATDYLEKGDGPDRYTLLANRIENAVSKRRTEQRLQAFTDHSTDMITVLAADGTIRYKSPSVENVLGYEPERLVGENAFEYVHPDDRDAVMAEFERAVADPDATPTAEFRFRHADNSWRWLESIANNQLDNPTVSGFVVNSRDLIERKERARALESLHDGTRELMDAETKRDVCEVAVEWARSILDHPIVVIGLADAAAGELRPVAATSEAKALVDGGMPPMPEESLAWNAYEAAELRVHTDVPNEDDVYNPETDVQREILLPLGDHGIMSLARRDPGTFDPIDRSIGRTLAANIETALDRADRIEELKAQHRRVQRQNERLDQFADIVTHDLRNPVAIALTQLERGRDECDSDHLDHVASALDRMEQIIDETLTLARSRERVTETESVELAELVDRCWRTIETADAQVTVEGNRVLNGDVERLRQLFENLFRNTIDHARADVTVRVGVLDDGFYIEDDGPGIPEDEREEVFETGYSTSDDGVGLGLTVVEWIVEAHGWDVAVGEGSDGGTRIEVTGIDADG